MGSKWPALNGGLFVALLVLGGCGSGSSSVPERLGTSQQLSVTTSRVYGFESLQDWTALWSKPTLTLSQQHSEGQVSLALHGGGWMQVQSRALSKEGPAPTVVGYDVRIPANPVNPSWYGTTALLLDAPSVGIWGRFIGYADLTGFPKAQFQRVEFPLPPRLVAKLNGNFNDLKLRIVVNVSANETADYLFDHFTFGPATCTPQSDGNPCTDDVCVNGAPAWTPRVVGSLCDTDSTVCDGSGTCNAAANCVIGPAPTVDDGNPCTSDACDPVAGAVHLPVAVGVTCETDGDVCNGVSHCDAAALCVPGSPLALDDGNPCTTDSCDPATGVHHAPTAAGSACDDGNACTSGDSCNAGACVAGTPKVCVTADACHGAGVCDPSNGLCSTPSKVDGTHCDDGNACTLNDVCASGACQGVNPVVCVAQDACHSAGVCDSATGACSNPKQSNGLACDDATVCNGRETCQNGSCVASAPPSLDDANPCTADACDPTAGVIHTAVADGTSCDSDGNLCNGVSACHSGACQPGPAPTLSDGNPCTTDSCDPATGVHHAPTAAGSACDDGNACTSGDSCNAGACVAGTPKVCVAADACHGAGVCDPSNGLCSTPSLPHDNGNDCTVDVCDAQSGQITHTPAAAGTPCAPLDACHEEGACNAIGQCAPGEPLPFDDGDPCTIETCDPVKGLTRRSCTLVDPTIATVPADALEWRYSGADPLQTGVSPNTIARQRAASVSGRMLGEQGLPLGGVKVTVLDHPEFGETLSQTNGNFDLVVNGGGDLVIEARREGFLVAHRAVKVPWADYVRTDDMVLIQADPAVGEVDLADVSRPFQVVQGSQNTDADGSRRGTALVPAGTVATMVNADGTTEDLDFLSVRITEFTVGALGQARMPATLPPLSKYTYAFEINADEAVAVGAKSVSFSQPLIYYVDNFLNFPSGTPVPLGSYSREKGIWVPSPSGIVIKIVSVTGGLADVSINLDAAAETPAELLAVGITDNERAKLATLYPVGKSLWRVLLPHFTSPWDCNWGASPPPDAIQPPPTTPPKPPNVPDPCEGANASTIECQNQILRESVPVAGTPFELDYSSERVPGWTAGLIRDVVVTGGTVPASLLGARLTVDVAGKTYSQNFPPLPNQTAQFTWDGLDSLGRPVMGGADATINVGFDYALVYTPTAVFGYSGNGIPITGDRARGGVTLNRPTTMRLSGLWDQRRLGLGAWSLSIHHAYDPQSRTLYRGDGTRQAATATGIVGYANVFPNPTFSLGAGLRRVAAAPDGSVYVSGLSSASYNTVSRVAPNGATTLIAGQLNSSGYSGDNGPATQATLKVPQDVELAPDGTVFIADTGNHCVRKVTPDGIIRTVAGTGTQGFSGDGGPASLAMLNGPRGLGYGPDGALYIADTDNKRVRRVGVDGVITTVAGNGSLMNPYTSFRLENVVATSAQDWTIPTDVAVEADGGLLISDWVHVRRVSTKGLVTTAAGRPCTDPDPNCFQPPIIDGAPAALSSAGQPVGLVTRPDRSFYFADGFYTHYVDPDGIGHVIAGGGTNTGEANGVPGTAFNFVLRAEGVAVGPGGIFVTDSWNPRLITLRDSALPPFTDSNMTVASTDGTEVYQFDSRGRHQATRDAVTGALRYQFGYESHGFLASVTDAYNNVTTVERDTSGKATAIIGPYGQRTQLGYDTNGYLASVSNPLGQSVGMGYGANGLLTSFQNARGQSSAVHYDARGRLLVDRDAAGARKTLTRTDLADGWKVDYASDDQGTKTFEIHNPADGTQLRKTTFADGTTVQQKRATDGTFTTTLADGTIDTTLHSADPRYGIETPILSRTVRLPSGLTYTETSQRTVTLTNPTDSLSVATLVNKRTVNDRIWSEAYDASTKTWTLQTPAGRRTFRRVNALGDLVEDRSDTLLAEILAYDTRGRVSSVTQGTRQSLFSYFTTGAANGYLQTTQNPLLQTTSYARDPLGRALSQLDPQSNLTSFSWDPDGNLASVTPPGRPAHGMDYTPVNLMSEYSPPVLASLPDGRTVYEYNLARQVTRATRPDGLVSDYTYDAAGRLTDIVTPSGTSHRDYYGLIPCAGCAAGRVSHLTSPDAVALDYQYDGQLLTKATWSGGVNGAVGFVYNTDFRVKTETVTSTTGTAAYQFGFDSDTLLTCASPTNCATPGADAFTLTYDGNHGLPTGSALSSALGSITEALTHTTVGELATQTAKVGTTTVFSETYDSGTVPRDALGRIKRKVEVVNGASNTWDYTYDLAGRLQTVQLNGSAYESYSYDGNGNRLTVVKPSDATSATYDNQDRLLSYGPWTYSYTPNGELLTKINSSTGASWAYKYDVFGNLKRVDLPTGDVVEYLVDGQNRRVGKKRNGTLVKQWLYENQLHPAAELAGSGALQARFVWASKKNAPDLIVRGGVTYRVFTDQLGSPRTLVNAGTGAVAGVMRHDAWGVVLEDSASTLMPFGFAGGLYDAETGLIRFGARDYDPQIGRWVSKDPIRFGGHQANLYVYVGNDPVNRIDPSGLQDGMGGASGFGEGGGEGAPGALGDDDGGLVCGGDDDFAKCWEDCMDAQGADYAAGVFVGLSPFAPTPKTAWELGRTMGGGASMTTWASRLSAGLGMAASNSLRSAGAVAGKVSALPYAFAGGYYGGSAAVCSAECG